MTSTLNTERFNGLADSYVKARPSYPAAILQMLRSELGLKDDSIIADIGSGTGILAKLFLDADHTVYCVEPNNDMRNAAVQSLSSYPGFKPVAAPAESTTLASQSVDLVVIAQALHLFDIPQARQEFRRILRNGAPAMLVWNFSDLESKYHSDYIDFLRDHGKNVKVGKTHTDTTRHDARIQAFFGGPYNYRVFKHQKLYSWENYLERMKSSSEIPRSTDPGYKRAMEALRDLFDKHQKEGMFTMTYHARVYFGEIAESI